MKETEVLYPPVVMAHIIDNLEDVIFPKITNKDLVQIHYGVQLNGPPHIGTMTSLATAFAIGNKIKQKYKIPTIVKFGALENTPKIKKTVKDLIYAKLFSDFYEEGESISASEKNMVYFLDLLSSLKERFNINYDVRYYQEFQAIAFVRKTFFKILDNERKFSEYLSPSDRHLRYRFTCPDCRFQEKTAKTTRIIDKDIDKAVFSQYCFRHNEFKTEIGIDGKNLLDLNTPLRNVIKEAEFIEEAKKKKAINVIVEGGDWFHIIPQIENCLGLLGYNISDLPTRIFTPMIEDWSGAKFSKSIYLKHGTYDYLPKGFENYNEFINNFGQEGINKLWDEVTLWAENPKRFYRNYSLDYFIGKIKNGF